MKNTFFKRLAVGLAAGAVMCCQAGAVYSDVSAEAWYYDAVNEATEAGLVNGYEDGTFRPNKYVSRAEAAVVLSNIPAKNGWQFETSFSDVPQNTWYTAAASTYGNYLGGRSVVTDPSKPLGYTAYFYPAHNIEREDFAVGLYNLFELEQGWKVHYTDLDEITWEAPDGYNYRQAACAMGNLGIMVGDENGSFHPKRGLTRAQLAQILCNIKNTDELCLLEKMK